MDEDNAMLAFSYEMPGNDVRRRRSILILMLLKQKNRLKLSLIS
jgi:hypothetical protein